MNAYMNTLGSVLRNINSMAGAVFLPISLSFLLINELVSTGPIGTILAVFLFSGSAVNSVSEESLNATDSRPTP